ncbi:MAG: hypothetical protein OXI59_14880 [Gemmatimonadota bacterium]|nr:hypothetical protein [Gemmatimonadota bacterium]MYD62093.1 hypothetical protein [Gemmatimonadota bacterium]
MINPSDIVIPSEKLTEYLLVPRVRNDKSKFLSQAGFTTENPAILEQAIRDLIIRNDAVQERENIYGTFYRVSGELVGPSDILSVVTIWIVLAGDGKFRFVTLKPDKE